MSSFLSQSVNVQSLFTRVCSGLISLIWHINERSIVWVILKFVKKICQQFIIGFFHIKLNPVYKLILSNINTNNNNNTSKPILFNNRQKHKEM